MHTPIVCSQIYTHKVMDDDVPVVKQLYGNHDVWQIHQATEALIKGL